MEELICLGAYWPGSSPDVDEAIGLYGPKEEAASLTEGYQRLAEILRTPETEN